MKKKALSCILSVAMITALSVPAVYADAPVWAEPAGVPASPWTLVPSTYYVTSEYHHSGDYALFVNGNESAVNDKLNMIQHIGSPDTSSEYTLTFYAHEANLSNLTAANGLFWSWNVQVRFSTEDSVQHLNAGGFTRTQEEDGWWKYTATYKPVNGADTNLHIIFNRNRDDIPIVIDDITLTKAGSEENLVKNGGFEEYDPFAPKLELTAGNGFINVGWKNPPTTSEAFSLTVGGEEIDVSDADMSPNASNSKKVSGLENGVEYEVVLTASTSFGELTSTGSAIPKEQINGSSSAAWYGTADAKTNYYITTSDSHSGAAALYINGPGENDKVDLMQSVEHDTSSEYTISFYIKGINTDNIDRSWNMQLRLANGNGVGHLNDTAWTKEETENGWWHYTATYVPSTTDENFHIIHNGLATRAFLIDDITLTKAGDDTNLLMNSGFERFEPFAIYLSAIPGDGKITLSWTNPAITAHSITATLNGEEIDISGADQRAGAGNEKIIDGLSNGTEYTVEVTASTNAGVYTAQASVTPKHIIVGKPTGGWEAVPAQFMATNEESSDGEISLKVTDGTAAESNSSVELTQRVKFSESKSYTVTVYGKNVRYPWSYRAYPGGFQSVNLDQFEKEDAGNGWTKYTYTYDNPKYEQVSGDYNGNFHFVFSDNTSVQNAYFDNISMTEVGDESNTNLLLNGSFEVYRRMADAVYNAYYSEDYEGIFWNISGSPSYFKVYKLVNGERVFIGRTEMDWFDLSSADISDAEGFVITSVFGTFETAGVDVVFDSLQIDPIFAKGDIDGSGRISIDKKLLAVETGSVVAGVNIINRSDSGVDPDIYAALYNHGILQSISRVSPGEIAAKSDPIESGVYVSVPKMTEEDDYSIRIFVWNKGAMKPVCEPFRLD